MRGRLLRRISFIYYWDKALHAASREDYKKADRALSAIPEPYNNFIEPKILNLVVLRELNRDDEILDAVDSVISKIQMSVVRSPADTAYLIAFLKFLALGVHYRAKGLPLPKKYDVDWAVVDIGAASGHLKGKFPLVGHPGWQNAQ